MENRDRKVTAWCKLQSCLPQPTSSSWAPPPKDSTISPKAPTAEDQLQHSIQRRHPEGEITFPPASGSGENWRKHTPASPFPHDHVLGGQANWTCLSLERGVVLRTSFHAASPVLRGAASSGNHYGLRVWVGAQGASPIGGVLREKLAIRPSLLSLIPLDMGGHTGISP